MQSSLRFYRTATAIVVGVHVSVVTVASAPQLAERQSRSQPASASVLSEHHLEMLDAMEPQAQAEFLLERAINHYQGANEQIAARAARWRGKITLDKRLNGLFVTALNSDDLRVRAAAIELNLAALDLEKSSATVDRLEPDARAGAQGPRANALWRIGLLGNRGVEPDRALQILLHSIHDENVNVRYWAVEGMAYLGTDDTIDPLLDGVSRRSLTHDSGARRVQPGAVGNAERDAADDCRPAAARLRGRPVARRPDALVGVSGAARHHRPDDAA